MSSVTIYFNNRVLEVPKLTQGQALALTQQLNAPLPGVTTIERDNTTFTVNRTTVQYVETRLT